MIRYLDTSAYLKTLVEEPDSQALVALLQRWRREGDLIVSSSIIVTELHRARRRAGIVSSSVSGALDRLRTVRVSNALLEVAGGLPGEALRSLDAIHIATALEVDADSFVTADRRQGDAARAGGLEVVPIFG